jgi:hypothetical protein
MIVDGRLGADALPPFHERFMEGGIDAARGAAIGHYSAAVRKGKTIFAFTDEQAGIPLYYASLASGGHVLSNSLQIVASAAGPPDIDPMGFVALAFHNEAVGENTLYRGVKRLFGSQLIELDLQTRRLAVRDLALPLDELRSEGRLGIEDAVAAYASRVSSVFSQIAAQPSVGVNTTGGLDTRTVLAALLAEGGRPLLMYGIGNSKLTNTKYADLQAARAISAATKLPLHEMDWSGNQPHDPEKLSTLFRRYGFLYTAYSSSEGVLAELEGRIHPYPSLQLGGYSPAFINRKPWEANREQYDLGYLIKHFSPYIAHLKPAHRDAYQTYLAGEIRQALARGSIRFPEHGATDEQFVRARLFLNLPMTGSNPNFFNEFAFYLAPFSVKRLCDPLLTLPVQYRQGDEFQLRLIAALDPGLLEIAMFSGLKPRVIDRDAFVMKRAESGGGSGRSRSAPRMSRLLSPQARAAIRRRAASWSVMRGTDPTNDQAKDARVTARVRRHTMRQLRRHPLTDNMFADFDFVTFSRLYTLHMRLSAVDEMRRRA